jgi:hypothetical protein
MVIEDFLQRYFYEGEIAKRVLKRKGKMII